MAAGISRGPLARSWTGFYSLRVHRFYTPLLRRLYFLAGVILGLYFSLQMIERSPWNKERLYRRLISGNRPQRLSAAVRLVDLNAQDELLRALKNPSADSRQLAENSLWHLWSHAAGEEAFRSADAAGRAMESRAFDEAQVMLNALVRQYPAFAEGWNRRALLHWHLKRYEASLADCKKVLALNPQHFGAWQSMGLCQLSLGDLAGACRSLRTALEITPHDAALRQFLQKCEKLWRRISPDATPQYEMV
ncbi:MAG: tetratricopeptide repeat protein [Chloroflexi bacterium]|nr:tetratricopeptide repeat protein [Chloroflexota bacterium]